MFPLRKKIALALLIQLSISAHAFAHTPGATSPTSQSLSGQINNALKSGKSLKTFFSEIGANYGGNAIAALLEIASDEKATDETRWAALFGLARLAGKESMGVIKKFMFNSSWMLRDAALKTAAAVNARELEPMIEQRLKDDALIVRTTAVETIGHLHLKEAAPRLVDALFDPINFHGGKALWIHKHILNVLADMNYQNAVPKLVQLLSSSKDEKLQSDVVDTLEKLTGKKFRDKSLKDQIYLWKRNTLSEQSF